MKRIVILEAIQESNSYCYVNYELKDFYDHYYYYGEDVMKYRGHAGTEVHGFVDILSQEEDIEIVPLFATHATSGGAISAEAYEKIAGDIREGLQKAGHVDGICAALHGAMLSVSSDDPEGDFLQIMREIVGEEVPIFATMDLHGNITRKKFENATGIVGFRHYPHDDSFQTGQRAARLLVKTVKGEIQPVMALGKAPMLVPCNTGTIGGGPMEEILKNEDRMEEEKGILAVTVFPVQPWLNVPETGFAAVVIADGEKEQAVSCAQALARMGWELKEKFEREIVPPAKAIELALEAEEDNVILVDTADAPGGGSTGDSNIMLKALLEAKVTVPCCVSVVDSEAADKAARAGIGAKVTVSVGNKIDVRRGTPIEVTGTVRRISDGRFVYAGLFAGSVGDMGTTVVLQVGEIALMISSRATYEWDDGQYRCAGINVSDYKMIVIKNPMSYQKTYQHITKRAYILDTPGPSSANLKSFPFERINHPKYPFDQIENPVIETLVK